MMRTTALLLCSLVLAACAEDPDRAEGDALPVDLGDAGAADRGPGAESGPDLPGQADLGDASPTPDTAVTGDSQQPDTTPPTTEILLFDGDNLQFTAADNGFHPLIKPGDTLPASNWLAPIDYYNGEFQIRYVIKSPANQAAGKLQTCIWTMGNGDGDGKNYFPESCSGQISHTGVGTYTLTTKNSPALWWNKDGTPLDFTHPEWFLIRVVLRGTSGCNVTTYNVTNACWSEWPSFQNMIFRVTIVMVAKGKTFSGWSSYP